MDGVHCALQRPVDLALRRIDPENNLARRGRRSGMLRESAEHHQRHGRRYKKIEDPCQTASEPVHLSLSPLTRSEIANRSADLWPQEICSKTLPGALLGVARTVPAPGPNTAARAFSRTDNDPAKARADSWYSAVLRAGGDLVGNSQGFRYLTRWQVLSPAGNSSRVLLL